MNCSELRFGLEEFIEPYILYVYVLSVLRQDDSVGVCQSSPGLTPREPSHRINTRGVLVLNALCMTMHVDASITSNTSICR